MMLVRVMAKAFPNGELAISESGLGPNVRLTGNKSDESCAID